MTDQPAVDLSPEAVKALCIALGKLYGCGPFSLVDHYPHVRNAVTTIRALSAALAVMDRDLTEYVRTLNQVSDDLDKAEAALADAQRDLTFKNCAMEACAAESQRQTERADGLAIALADAQRERDQFARNAERLQRDCAEMRKTLAPDQAALAQRVIIQTETIRDLQGQLAEAQRERDEDVAKRQLAEYHEREYRELSISDRAELSASRAIVSRIWAIFGIPDYATGLSIYDLVQGAVDARTTLATERADHARTRAMLKLMCDAADEMNKEIDRQVIDEMRRAEYDPPDDAEFVIMLTTKQMRALNDPICVCQKYLRDTASASVETPPRQHVERWAERRAPQEFLELKRRAITASEKRRPGNRRRAADREGK